MPQEKPQEVERETLVTNEGGTIIIQTTPAQTAPAIQESADVKDPISITG